MIRRYLPRGRGGWLLAAIGLVALVLCLALGTAHPRQAWLGYLVIYLFVLGLALGSMAIIMIHALTGGGWGFFLRPQLLAATRTLPLLALGLVPLLVGAAALFPWLPGPPVHDPHFAHQAWYLNRPFLTSRAVVFMLLWLGWAAWLERCLQAPRPRRLRNWAVSGLVMYVLSASLFGVDWIMALEPRWHSTTFGLTYVTAQMLGASACCGVLAARAAAARDNPLVADVGKLLMMFLLAFIYLAFMDYLTAWVGNLPAETVWYVPRTRTSWKWVAAFVLAFELVLPFFTLLSRRGKRHPRRIAAVATLMLVANFAWLLWMVAPAGRPQGLGVYWTDILAVIGLGAMWRSVFEGGLWQPLPVASTAAAEAGA
ncbi:MAG TPA: hypothetical protein VFG73_08325 [Rhodanobacteraceae bacterium]|nr:hypothetical protein [Rhodanobacteraceae bacterium]